MTEMTRPRYGWRPKAEKLHGFRQNKTFKKMWSWFYRGSQYFTMKFIINIIFVFNMYGSSEKSSSRLYIEEFNSRRDNLRLQSALVGERGALQKFFLIIIIYLYRPILFAYSSIYWSHLIDIYFFALIILIFCFTFIITENQKVLLIDYSC